MYYGRRKRIKMKERVYLNSGESYILIRSQDEVDFFDVYGRFPSSPFELSSYINNRVKQIHHKRKIIMV